MLGWPVGTSAGYCVVNHYERTQPSVDGTIPQEGVLDPKVEESG